MDALSNTLSSTSSTGSLEIGDYMFCMHGNEACRECNSDMREDNSFVSGVDHVAGREGIVVQFALDKDGHVLCKKHKLGDCGNCLNFKKQIIKLNKDAAKSSSKKKPKESNFF